MELFKKINQKQAMRYLMIALALVAVYYGGTLIFLKLNPTDQDAE